MTTLTALRPRGMKLLFGEDVSQRGDAKSSMMALIMGVIIIVVGLVLEATILSRAATAGSDTNIGSFAGAQALNDLVPLVYNAAIVIMGVGLIGLGAAGLAGRGPIR